MLINKQIQTERGLVFVKESFHTCADAEQAGYHPAFFSSKLNLELYSKVLDAEGHHYDFAIIGGGNNELD